jgi:vacuolar-type H+-ATPase subunit H
VGGFWNVLGLGVVAVGVVLTSAAIAVTLRGARPTVFSFRSRLRRAAGSAAAVPADRDAPPNPATEAAAVPARPVDRAARAGRPSTDPQEDPESLIGRTLLAAQRSAEDVLRGAQARADEIIRNAEAIAHELVQASHVEAAATLQKARDEADASVASARQKTAAWLAQLEAETNRVVADAQQAFRQAQQSVEQRVAAFPSRLEPPLPHGPADAAEGNGHDPERTWAIALAEEPRIALHPDAAAAPPANGRL